MALVKVNINSKGGPLKYGVKPPNSGILLKGYISFISMRRVEAQLSLLTYEATSNYLPSQEAQFVRYYDAQDVANTNTLRWDE
ncbi:hypothetical protein GCM10007971_37560 [Oceanobacillus indicireducens]|uniref:Uncharacterized protein n=1 Tax=Oceanobacillus indicireducens TaxID=1004261 RepID=A0A917Y3V3_9BACI|nr:hypothetical protein GCM10007971_37560 [Oceanobacillus indicireducens]